MKELSKLPNISKIIEAKLNEADITTKKELYQTGSKEAFIRIRLKDPTACVHMLYAIEGAIQGIRWHNLPEDTKSELKKFHDSL